MPREIKSKITETSTELQKTITELNNLKNESVKDIIPEELLKRTSVLIQKIKALKKQIDELNKKAGETGEAFDNVDTSSLEDSLKKLLKLITNFDITKAGSLEELIKGFSTLEGEILNNIDVFGELTTVTTKLSGSFTKLVKNINTKEWQKLGKILGLNESQIRKVSKEYSDAAAKLKEYNSKIKDQVKAWAILEPTKVQERAAIEKTIDALETQKKAVEDIVETYNDLVETANDVTEREMEVGRAGSIVGQILNEGAEEAKYFGRGLGGSAIGLTAAGVAITYTASKLKELGGELIELQKAWAEYNVETARAAHVIPDFEGGSQGLDELRKRLRLSRDEALAFQKVIKEASVSGVITTANLVKAAKQLADTYGGDPTEALREYIDLLKTIPSLETDLNITASVDKQAEAWFALAEKGKVQQVIELQTAGLLAGEQGEGMEGSKAEVEALKTQRESNVWLDNISKKISDLVPSSLAYYTASALIFTQTLATLGTIGTSIVGFWNIFSNISRSGDRQVEKLQDVENAIRETKSIPGAMPNTLRVKGFKLPSQMKTQSGAARRLYRLSKARDLRSEMGSMSWKPLTSGLQQLTKGVGLLNGVLPTTVLSFARLLGPIGLVVSALGVAATAIYNGKETGKLFEEFGNYIGKDGPRIGQAFGFLLTNTTPVSTAFGLLGVDASRLSNIFGDMLKNAGEWWQDFGDEAYEYLFVSEKEKDARMKSATAEFKKSIELRKTNKELKKTQKSAIALEKVLGYIKAASESPINELARLGQEVAGLKMETLKLAGGDALDFSNAVKEGVGALEREFNNLNNAFDHARSMILKDTDMTTEMKRAATLKLNKAELENTKKFIDSMISMTGNFDKLPEVAKANLQRAFKMISVDMQEMAGTDLFGTAFDDIGASLESAQKAAVESALYIGKNSEVIQSIQGQITEKTKITGEKFNEELSSITDDLKKSGGDITIAKKIKSSVEVEGETKEIKVKDKGKLEEALQQTADEISKLESSAAKTVDTGLLDELEKSKKIYDEAREKGQKAVNSLGTVNQSISDMKMEMVQDLGVEEWQKWNKELDEIVNSNENAVAKQVKLENLEKRLREKDESSAKRLSKMISVISSINTMTDETTNLQEERRKAHIEQENIENDIVTWAKKNTDLGKKGNQNREQLLEAGKDELEKLKSINNKTNSNLIALDNRRKFLEKILNKEKAQTATLQSGVKSTEELAEIFKIWLSTLDRLVDSIDKSGTIQKLQRQLELSQEERKYREAIGTSASAYVNEWKKEIEVTKAELENVEKAKEKIKSLRNSSDGLNQMLEGMTKDFDIMKTNLDKAFQGLGMDDVKDEMKKKADNIKGMVSEFAEALKGHQEALKSGDKVKIGESEKKLEDIGKRIGAAKRQFDSDLDKASKKSGGKLDTTSIKTATEQMLLSVNALSGGIDKASDRIDIKEKQIRTKFLQIGEDIDVVINSLKASPIQKYANAIYEESEAMFDLAEMMGDSKKSTEARVNAEKALGESYSNLLKQLAEAEAGILEKRDFKLAETKDVQEQAKIRKEAEEALAKISKEKVMLESNRLKKISEWNQRAIDSQLKVIDLRQQEIDMQRDVLETVGASVGLLIENQQRDLANAREKAKVLKSAYENAAASGLVGNELEQKRLQYITAAAEVAKKSMAMQRDAFDKLMDKAFGAIRGERGGRKQLMTKAQMFGTGYVQQAASGLIIPGKSKTLAQGQIERQIGAAAGPKAAKPEEKQVDAADKNVKAADQMQTASKLFNDSVVGFKGLLANVPQAIRGPIEGLVSKIYETAKTPAANNYSNPTADYPTATDTMYRTPSPVANGGIGGMTEQTSNVKVNASVGLSIDAEGNLKAVIKQVVQEVVPSLIRSDQNTQNALATQTPVKGR